MSRRGVSQKKMGEGKRRILQSQPTDWLTRGGCERRKKQSMRERKGVAAARVEGTVQNNCTTKHRSARKRPSVFPPRKVRCEFRHQRWFSPPWARHRFSRELLSPFIEQKRAREPESRVYSIFECSISPGAILTFRHSRIDPTPR